MRNWAIESGGCGSAELNATLVPEDCVIDPNMGTHDNAVYPDMATAIAAGERSLVLVPGDHDPCTITAKHGVHIRGVGSPNSIDISPYNCARITGSASMYFSGCRDVTLDNVLIDHTGSTFSLVVDDCYGSLFRRVHCIGPVGDHFRIINGLWLTTFEDCISDYCAGNAFISSANYTSSPGGWGNHFVRCRVFHSGGNGFYTGSNGSDTEPTIINFTDCTVEDSCSGWGAAFFLQKNWGGVLTGCVAMNCDGNGFYFEDPADTPNASVSAKSAIGCHALACGSGFAKQGGFTGARLTLAGCIAAGNSTNYLNFSSVPDTCVSD